MKPIDIRTIAHSDQRYSTLGDWHDLLKMADEPPFQCLAIRVSRMENPDYEFLVCAHELVEAYLCQKRGITAGMVDDFDFKWTGEGEPGDCPEAPYHKEHVFATKVEKIMAEELEVDWEVYSTYHPESEVENVG